MAAKTENLKEVDILLNVPIKEESIYIDDVNISGQFDADKQILTSVIRQQGDRNISKAIEVTDVSKAVHFSFMACYQGS